MSSHICPYLHTESGKPRAMISLCKDIHCTLHPIPALSHQQSQAVNHAYSYYKIRDVMELSFH
jgi:hypothetical protein